MEFSDPVDHWVRMKECKNIKKYLDLNWEMKKKTVEHEIDVEVDCC